MRILHVIGAMDRGGAETFIMNIYRKIDCSKIQFDFLVNENRECDYDEEIKKLGGRLFRVPQFKGFNALSYRKAVRKHFHDHPEHRIVHGHIGSSAAIYLSEAKKQGRFTIAHSHSQRILDTPLDFAFEFVSYPTRHIADYFFGCSYEAGVARFGKTITNSNRFSVISNAIDASLYTYSEKTRNRTRSELGIGPDTPIFGNVGRLAIQKNQAFLIHVFSKIQEVYPEAILLIVGRGPLENQLRDIAIESTRPGSVRFLGMRTDIPNLLQSMDVFIMPSTTEGLGIAAVEAQATGLPCLLSAGFPDLSFITDKTQKLELASGCEVWTKAALDEYKKVTLSERKDCIEEIKNRGFDICSVAQDLQRFYESIPS